MVRNPMDFCFFCLQNDLQSSFMEKYETAQRKDPKIYSLLSLCTHLPAERELGNLSREYRRCSEQPVRSVSGPKTNEILKM